MLYFWWAACVFFSPPRFSTKTQYRGGCKLAAGELAPSSICILRIAVKALIERCLSAELDTHLAEEKAEVETGSLGEGKAEHPRNRHNEHRKKTIKGEFGESEMGIPRDRNEAFELRLIAKGTDALQRV
jgi:transposase-like protein